MKIVTKSVITFQICSLTDFARLRNISIVLFYHDDKNFFYLFALYNNFFFNTICLRSLRNVMRNS